MNYLRTLILYKIYKWKHYKTILFNILFSSLIFIVLNYLKGAFVGEINLSGREISYIYFLLFSIVFYEAFDRTLDFSLYIVTSEKDIYEMNTVGIKNYVFSNVLYILFSTLVSLLPLVFVITFVATNNLFRVLIGSIFGFLVSIPALSYGMMISPLMILFKGEDRRFIIGAIHSLDSILVPLNFSLLIIPKKEIVEILLPSAGITEELRNFILYGSMNLTTFVLSVIAGLIYLFLGWKAFNYTINWLRREGWVGLR